MIRFSAEFVMSASSLDGCPRWKRSEVALAGRSNVGKSSLLNALTGVKGLARTSKTPGRTRALNFFAVNNDTLALCDLPGFGYAKMSHADAAKIASMMVGYMRHRANLDAIAILVDCRRGPQEDELSLARMATERGIEVIAVATKCDKLRRSDRAPALKRFDAMGVPPIFCSATSGEGLDDLRRRILAVDRTKSKTTPQNASASATFDEWLKWVFDHPVAGDNEKEWWWQVPDADEGGIWFDRPPIPALTFVTRLFENPLAYLSQYSDAQIDQGLWFIVHSANSKHLEWLVDGRVDLILRKRCISSIENLSRQLLAPRCSEDVIHGTNPLDSICHMIWDLAIHDARDLEIDKESVRTLARIITIPSIACQQSALHGLGHLVRDARLGADVIQKYLDDHPDLRSDFRKYAQQALVGKIL